MVENSWFNVVNIWLIYGYYMVNIWLIYGYYMVNDGLIVIWLMVEPYPSEKYESVGMMTFPIYWKIENVPHQPDMMISINKT